MNIYLIGFMGSGKSSAGRRIAALLRWKFRDTDKLVEKKEGMTVSEIFASGGEQQFRGSEAAALREVASGTRTVVACGGGTPCSEENMGVMKSTGLTVYLRLPADILVSRLLRSRSRRPLLRDTGDAELHARVQEMLDTRSRWYEQADLVIDCEHVTDEEMTSMIAALVRSRGAYL